MRSIIPNALTALNLVFGVFAIISAYHGQFLQAGTLIFAAMIADGLDGRVARYFGVSGDFGKELDSLCDLVSFGVAPGFLAYVLVLNELGFIGMAIAALFATCGALRLARFNVNVGIVKGYFMGLPIPAAGCVIATFIMTGLKPQGIWFPIMMSIVALLMVSTIRYPDFKGKGEPIRLIPAILTLALAAYLIYTFRQINLFIPFFSFALFGILNTAFALFDKSNS
ncbi:CDP-diacylglycerol--serine O-phosphatidyltransferase [Anaerosporomusa subterranea]|uniref:CDP-diacylglycerol--serine O-phosphatidyltransferase n=1 Tax=Anaerosporomusa subterranea TaxID=1794912 RepID=A0A154BTF1_ANASB|nr:CDP-diacylglycerol--serine O-phosphatidyltransferase [Anaerosporomusa subterranea]KYZ77155.1 CDP-diacylglycerol--serine O-phosphatidyltransferase [Anaerosporomusa subterranea]